MLVGPNAGSGGIHVEVCGLDLACRLSSQGGGEGDTHTHTSTNTKHTGMRSHSDTG